MVVEILYGFVQGAIKRPSRNMAGPKWKQTERSGAKIVTELGGNNMLKFLAGLFIGMVADWTAAFLRP